jgi:hypothetical protein
VQVYLSGQPSVIIIHAPSLPCQNILVHDFTSFLSAPHKHYPQNRTPTTAHTDFLSFALLLPPLRFSFRLCAACFARLFWLFTLPSCLSGAGIEAHWIQIQC